MPLHPDTMFFTSESVAEGHPDKFCDQVSDAVLDACLREDALSRVACECYVTKGLVVVGGEVSTRARLEVEQVVREVSERVGYTAARFGFDADSATLVRALHTQSPDIDLGVSRAGVISAPATRA